MKVWFALSVLLLSSSALAQKQVFLDSPGVLEALERENPAHFAKVQRILEEAPRMPSPKVQEWIRTEFNASDVTAPSLIRTSLPAQADISFVLDDTRYRARIRLDIRTRVIPAQKK